MAVAVVVVVVVVVVVLSLTSYYWIQKRKRDRRSVSFSQGHKTDRRTDRQLDVGRQQHSVHVCLSNHNYPHVCPTI